MPLRWSSIDSFFKLAGSAFAATLFNMLLSPFKVTLSLLATSFWGFTRLIRLGLTKGGIKINHGSIAFLVVVERFFKGRILGWSDIQAPSILRKNLIREHAIQAGWLILLALSTFSGVAGYAGLVAVLSMPIAGSSVFTSVSVGLLLGLMSWTVVTGLQRFFTHGGIRTFGNEFKQPLQGDMGEEAPEAALLPDQPIASFANRRGMKVAAADYQHDIKQAAITFRNQLMGQQAPTLRG